jgi:hypothetical protein
MLRIDKSILEKCNSGNCSQNELIILPMDGDSGFETYFDHKSVAVKKVRKIFSPLEQNKLMLAYPKPESRDLSLFDRFFDSPSIVARNHDFEGCFAIDISAYINKETDDHFIELMSFVRNSPNIVFVLFMFTNNLNEIRSMHDNISQFGFFRLLSIPLASPRALTDYTIHHIRDFTLHVLNAVDEVLYDFYTQKSYGYDMADFIVRQLRNAEYLGDLDGIKTVLEETLRSQGVSGSSSNFGY